jgi:hypothetical protein
VGHKAKCLAGKSGNEAQIHIVVFRDVAEAKLGLCHREPAARRVTPKAGQAKVMRGCGGGVNSVVVVRHCSSLVVTSVKYT